MNLAERSVSSAAWSVGASAIIAGVLFVRSIILARLLPVDVFGVYTLAASIVTVSAILPAFGFGGAFMHRSAESQDEEHAARMHFTLTLLLSVAWVIVMVGASLLLSEGELRTALVTLTLVSFGLLLTTTPRLILTRRVAHRRLAVLDALAAVLTTAVAVLLAWRGATLNALLATDVAALGLTAVILYLWRPVWVPRLAWARSTVRYFFSFGSRSFGSIAANKLLDNLDDIWTGAYLGSVQLGFYSRAYAFATYPRRIVAAPVNAVAGGTYAEIKGQRLVLSKAFYRVNSLLIRGGYLLGGLLFVVAPEFVGLLLGEKWLPMIPIFRLMLIYTVLDPLKSSIGSLFAAVGRPELVLQARLIQLAVLATGLFILGTRWGTIGVAVTVNVMLLAGLAILLGRSRAYVDFSLSRLLAAPSLALLLGCVIALGAQMLLCRASASAAFCDGWLALLGKTTAYCLIFAGTLFILEREDLLKMKKLVETTLARRG